MQGTMIRTVGTDVKWEKDIVLFEKEEPDEGGVENEVINIYPERTYQKWEGLGGAVTDAAGYVYAQMSEEQKKEFLKAYFSEDGLNYRNIRVPIDSCDFSLEMYEAMSNPQDRELATFDMKRNFRHILPLLCDIREFSEQPISLMLSPWSPPAFMKSNQKRTHGGKLLPEYYEFWAEYICKMMEAYEAEGFQVSRISLQNEEKAVQEWDSCVYTAEEEKLFLKMMHKALLEHGHSGVEIYLWDHNKERLYERMRDVCDEETKDLFAGAAFHWYSGDHFESLAMAKEVFPDKKLILSESCIEFKIAGKETNLDSAMRLVHEMIGDMNCGMEAFYDWNMILDEKGGPNHVGNYCKAPFHYDMRKKQLIRSEIYDYYRHFGAYIRPGAVRIATTKYTKELNAVAFQNPDGQIVLVLQNSGMQKKNAVVRVDGYMAKLVAESKSVNTILITRLKNI
jgi:glucosylceramidase